MAKQNEEETEFSKMQCLVIKQKKWREWIERDKECITLMMETATNEYRSIALVLSFDPGLLYKGVFFNSETMCL